MTMPPAHSGTYFIEDQYTVEELSRISDQDQLVTASMGGVLAEQVNPGLFHSVLDVACGVGNWIIDMAQAYPDMLLTGIDINPRMISAAREQAEALNVHKRVEFYVMDALRVFDFTDFSFDLVNLRFALGFVRTWEWPLLLGEMLRVLRPGGVVRLTDEEVIHESSSPAAMQFCGMLLCALFRSGHLFAEESAGLTNHLASLLVHQGVQQVQTQAHVLQYRAGTPEGQVYAQDGVRLLHLMRPFLQRWGCLQGDYDALQQQVSVEVAQPDFAAIWRLLTVWGTKAE